METDAAWKRLFALPVMVEQLLRAVAPELACRLDFTAMEQLGANWARPAGGTDPRTGAQRYADAVWRIRYASGARTLVLLLEFQSTMVLIGIVVENVIFRNVELRTVYRWGDAALTPAARAGTGRQVPTRYRVRGTHHSVPARQVVTAAVSARCRRSRAYCPPVRPGSS